MSRQLRALVYAGGLAGALAVTACTAAGGPGPPASAAATVAGRPVIVVGSFNFPESVTLAYLYADALAGRGYPVRVLPDLGPRELVDPALIAGLIQLVPEYTGSALEFVSLGRVPATANVVATAAALATTFAVAGTRPRLTNSSADPVYSGTSWMSPAISAGSTSSRGPRSGSTRTGYPRPASASA